MLLTYVYRSKAIKSSSITMYGKPSRFEEYCQSDKVNYTYGRKRSETVAR